MLYINKSVLFYYLISQLPQQVYQDVLNTYNQHYLRALRNELGQGIRNCIIVFI